MRSFLLFTSFSFFILFRLAFISCRLNSSTHTSIMKINSAGFSTHSMHERPALKSVKKKIIPTYNTSRPDLTSQLSALFSDSSVTFVKTFPALCSHDVLILISTCPLVFLQFDPGTFVFLFIFVLCPPRMKLWFRSFYLCRYTLMSLQIFYVPVFSQ